MDKSQQQVREFNKAIGQPTSPAEPMLRAPVLRAQLILEEAIETAFALVGSVQAQNIVQAMLVKVLTEATQKKELEPDLCRAIDGLCDIKYVVDGTAEAIGIDLEPFFDEVHISNMCKLDGPVDASGKKLKPPGWKPPDIFGVLARTTCVKCGARFGDGHSFECVQ